MSSCSYCTGPLTGTGFTGRPWPGQTAASYCCYGCLSLGEQRRQEQTTPPAPTGWKLDGLGVRLGISILVIGQSMIFGLALNLHDDVPADIRFIAQSIILAATLLVVALLGGPLFSAAWRESRHGRLTLESLFLLTMSGALAASLQAHLTGRGHAYFEVISILLVVHTLGKLIGSRSRAAAMAGSRAWAGQLSRCRLVDTQGRTRQVPVTEIVPGDVVEVNPGETIAIDGMIREGIGLVSEAPVSGEPFPVVRRPGDSVLAGTASFDVTFRIEATKRGTERQVDRLLAAVEAARQRPVSFQAQAERIGRVFLPLIVVAAFATFGYWAFLVPAGWETALFNAMSVLLVACPCVIGLATPIVIWSTLGRLAERGLIVRAGDAVERLAEIDCVLFDKTGTLTDDSLVLLDIATRARGDERAALLGWLSLVEERSRHPVARAFARLPRAFTTGAEPRVLSLQAIPGRGIDAKLEDAEGKSHSIRIGTPEWIGNALEFSREGYDRELTKQLHATGQRIDVAVDGELAAVSVLAEKLRDCVHETLAAFEQLGVGVEVLSGDACERVRALGLPFNRGGLLPDDKRTAVEEAKAKGAHPLFVGDGINDAAALASAHAGVALASGADIALRASTMTLYHHDLRVLPWAVALSREAVRSVRRNLYRALIYNLAGMSLAASGLLHPVAAVLLMLASSLMLIFSATRIGISPAHCAPKKVSAKERSQPMAQRPGTSRALVHGLSIALQGIVFLLLLDAAREQLVAIPLTAGFAVAGLVLGRVWQRWSTIPHQLDMCVGMLTLGNLGMLLGWWADNGFAPLASGHCPLCVAMMSQSTGQPGMFLGMLVAANVAMLAQRRTDEPLNRDHARAMFTGGNCGMLLGMFAGGWLAAQITVVSVPLAVMSSFVGMTMGMIGGMLVGTWLIEKAIALARTIPTVPRWLRTGISKRTD